MKRFLQLTLACTLLTLAAVTPRPAGAADTRASAEQPRAGYYWCPWWVPLCALT